MPLSIAFAAETTSRPLLCAASLAVLLGLSCGCGDGALPPSEENTYFTPLHSELPSPERIEPDAVGQSSMDIPADRRKNYEKIYRGFEKNHEEILRMTKGQEMLGQVEIAYRLRNEYPHLLDIYQEDVAEHGPTSPAAPQLAWGLMNLGQEQQARQLIDQLLLVSPDEAMTWVLDGLFFLKNGETSPETLADAAVSWGRAINVGPEDPATAQVRRDLEALLERGELDRPQLTEARDRLAERLARIRERYPDLADAAPTTPGPVRDDTEPPSDSSTGDVEAAGEERAGVATPELASGAGGADSPDVRNAPNTERRAAGEADGASDAKTGSSAPPPTAAEERTDGERAALQIARGRIDLQRGSRDEALGHYRRAEELGTSSPRDLFAMMRLGWDLDRDRAKQRRRFAALVDRDDLDARLIYDLALFAGGALEDGPAAISLLERLVRDHATFAERVDAAALIRKYREE